MSSRDPEAIDALVLRALAFDASARFQTAAEMRRAIRAIRGQAQTKSVEDVAVELDGPADAGDADEDPTEVSDEYRLADVPKPPR